jgi:dTDP-4-dehydrorhamnose reductase
MSKNVLITGSNGQLGKELVELFSKVDFNVYGYNREQMDVTNQEKVQEIIHKIKPDIVLHSAAHTKVDLAESEPDHAYDINAYGTRNVAVASEQVGAKLVYVSTDYVFDGTGTEPYNEFSPTSPLGIYGKSKLAGERFVRDLHSKFFIVRTSWVYGKYGDNFVKTMLKLGEEREELSVVSDQIGCPTYTRDLANCMLELVQSERYGVYHVSNSGKCSWYEFAKAIFEEAGINVKVNACSTSEFPRPAARPANSVFDHMSLRIEGFKEMRPWKEGLAAFIEDIKIKG